MSPYLYEQVRLLTMKDEDGIPHNRSHSSLYAYIVAGAMLTDLFLNGYLLIDKEQRCTAPDFKGEPQDKVLADVWRRIRKSKKPKKLRYWIVAITSYHRPMQTALEELVRRGVVTRILKKSWFVFVKMLHPLQNQSIKQEIAQRLEKSLIPDTQTDPQTIMLLGFVKSGKLIPYVFPKQFNHDPDALHAAIDEALKKKQWNNFIDDIASEDTPNDQLTGMVDMSLDAFTITADIMNIFSDAIDSSIGDGGFGDGGFGDGSGDGGDSGGGDGGGGGD